MPQPIRLTVVSSSSCDMTKTYARQPDGGITSSAIAHMTAGAARVIDVAEPHDLRAVFEDLQPNQAITTGVPIAGDTKLTTRAGADFHLHAVARTNETFRYLDTPAFFPIDVDTDTGTYQTVEDVLDALEAASPWLRHVHRVARPSSSSYVDTRGLRGVHVYLPVTRGSDIPELGKRLQIEQWAAGRGYVHISRSGALLVRQLSDALVYQPSRLMFEARPLLEGVTRDVPLAQAWVERPPQVLGRPAAYKTPEGWLDAQLLPPVKDIDRRRFEVAVRQAKDRLRVEAKRVALDYHRANALAAGLPPDDRLGVLALRALGDKRLPATWPIRLHTDLLLTVGEIRKSLSLYLGQSCADPFDALRCDLTRAHLHKAEIVSMRGRPGVWSHKLQEFFEFAEGAAGDVVAPLDVAAEKLCGVIEEWPDRRDKKRNSLRNVSHAIELLAREAALPLRYDVCLDTIDKTELPTDAQWLAAVARLGCSSVSAETIKRAVEDVARAHPHDPWKDTVLALPVWDGKPRIDTFFADVVGSLPSTAQTKATQVFFAGLVKRQLQPGAPAPVVPVLIGQQGPGKGLFLIQLAEAAGFPRPTEIMFGDTRRMSMAAARAPLAELCEMGGMGRRDAEEIKQWITDTQDVYRAPYGRHEESHPRRFVLCGTANKWELNRDETGNRRFMPIFVEREPAPNWAVEVPQLLAEARARFCDDGPYYRLIREAADAVREYNREAMHNGLGTPVSDLDDLLPPILRRQLAGAGTQRVASAAIRTALDVQHSGRRITAAEIARWLKSRGWTAGTDRQGGRYYIAPASFIDNLDSNDSVAPVNPFTAA